MSIFRVTDTGGARRGQKQPRGSGTQVAASDNCIFDMQNRTILTAVDPNLKRAVWRAEATTQNKILSKNELDSLAARLNKLHKNYKNDLKSD